MAIICREHKLLFIMVPGTGCSVLGNRLMRELNGEWLPEKSIISDQGKVICSKKHNSVDQILAAGLMSEDELKVYTVFATVRNPFDRLTTYYQRLTGDWCVQTEKLHADRLENNRNDYSDADFVDNQNRLKRRAGKRRRRSIVLRTIGFNNWAKLTCLRWNRMYSSNTEQDKRLRFDLIFPMLSRVDIAIRYEKLQDGVNDLLRSLNIDKELVLPRKNVTPGKKDYREYYSRSTMCLWENFFHDELKVFENDDVNHLSSVALIDLSCINK